MRNVPDAIYMQIGPDCDADDFNDLAEVTWSREPVFSNDIEFIRVTPDAEIMKRHIIGKDEEESE